MKNAGDLLDAKGREIFAVTPEASVFECLEVLASRDIGAVLVMDEDGGLVGIFSERDYARQVILKGKQSRELFVREVMSGDVVGIEPRRTVDECMAIMTERRIRHLPVIEAGDVVGLLSIGDVVKSMLEEKQFQIEQLETYISQG